MKEDRESNIGEEETERTREKERKRERERGEVVSILSWQFSLSSVFCVECEGFCGKKELNPIFLRILMNFHIQQARDNVTATK